MSRFGCLAIMLWLQLVGIAIADPQQGEFEVHDVALWITDTVAPLANPRAAYASALPHTVSSLRTTSSTGDPLNSAPVGLITFHGQPSGELDVELKLTDGAFLAHWPTAEGSNNRVRWPRKSGYLLVEKPDVKSDLAWVSDEHWFQQARRGDALFVRGARAERFLAYDAELKVASPIVLEGGPDHFTLANVSDDTLYDVVVARKTPQGVRVGWLDTLTKTDPKTLAAIKENKAGRKLPKTSVNLFGLGKSTSAKGDSQPAEGKDKSEPKPAVSLFGLQVAPAGTAESDEATSPPTSAELSLSEPMPVGSDGANAATRGTLAERLRKVGLADSEIDLFLNQYASLLFESDNLVVACRLAPEAIDRQMTLSVFPVPMKVVRVPIVLVRNADPQLPHEIDALIQQLGDTSYQQRQAAEKRLTELGAQTIEPLKKALQNNDLEVAIRAEGILLQLGQQAAGRVGATEIPAAAVNRTLQPVQN